MKKVLIVAALALTLAPSSARAEWLLTPNVGGSWNGPGADGFTWGVSLGWASVSTIFGAEADFGFSSNNFFSTDEADLLGIDRDLFDARVSTFMGNVLIQPWGGSRTNMFRPYAVAGIGVINLNIDTSDDLFDFESDNGEFGWNVGGGALGFVTDNVGFRGDIRFFRTFDEPTLGFDLIDAGIVNRVDVVDVDVIDIGVDRDFWRATGGVTFRW
jgi:opacity protein-like surface antigen